MKLNLDSLKNDEKLIVAVSGGADSVCLLDLLAKQQYQLIIAHLHHGLRGKEADRDQNFVEKLAQKYKVPFETAKVKVKTFAKQHKLSIEEAARQLRYEFLDQVKQKHHAKFIVTAHTLDDQAETILMNLVRGSGLRGLAGMSIINQDILRPLLESPKSAVCEYLRKHKLKYVEDSSNQDLFFTRNKFRIEIIPKLQKINPGLMETLGRNGKILGEIHEYIEKEASHFLKKNLSKKYFSRHDFLILPQAIQNIVIRQIYRESHGNNSDLGFELVQKTRKLIAEGKTGKKIIISKKLTFRINYARVEFDFAPQKPISKVSRKNLNVPGKTNFLEQQISASYCKRIGSLEQNVAYLEAAKVEKLFLRCPQLGDRFQPLGLKGSKKLQDFFTDEKISAKKRSSVPIVVNCKDEIVWVGGYRVSEKFKATQHSPQILKLKIHRS